MCSCDDNKACDMHADELYNFGDFIMPCHHATDEFDICVYRCDAALTAVSPVKNIQVAQPFRSILDQMLKDAETDAGVREAVKVLYGDEYLTSRMQEPSIPVTLDQLQNMMVEAGIRSYCDQCDMWRDGNGCKFC